MYIFCELGAHRDHLINFIDFVDGFVAKDVRFHVQVPMGQKFTYQEKKRLV